jgi:hypothetical protein
MIGKLILAAFLLFYGVWIVAYPARTAGMKTWQECSTVKGLICVPKLPAQPSGSGMPGAR